MIRSKDVIKVIADSSSLILLQKVGLLSLFLEKYAVVISQSVFEEVTGHEKKGVRELYELLQWRITQPLVDNRHQDMGKGESSVISLYEEGAGDFVLLDDKKAAIYCRDLAIPFVNSLLVPRIFLEAGMLSKKECEKFTSLLIRYGYYSASIVIGAAKIPVKQLEHFFPM
jgi:predicted nucleic acid-binding protein